MKKIIVLALIATFVSCSTDDLELVNPNSPGEGSVSSEDGIKAYALGIMEKGFGYRNNLEGGNSGYQLAIGFHGLLGDDLYMPWGNWGWRFYANYKKIITPDGVTYEHTLFPGVSMLDVMRSNNSRQAGELNATKYEWYAAYQTIGQCNQLLKNLESDIAFSGDAETKKKTLQAWAKWWKGFMYSRVGSIYLSGLIVNDLGQTNGDYVTRQDIIVEADANFDEAIALLNTLSAIEDYEEIMTSIIPDFNNPSDVVTPQMWIRMINTYKARNILVNKKVADMSSADWNAVLALANQGLQDDDNIFTLGMSPDGQNDFANSFYHPYYWNNTSNGWWFVSERLTQEYKSGDERFARDFYTLPNPEVNRRNRGWIFGTRYGYNDIEDGGTLASRANQGQWPISPTFEENELMKAEAKLRTGDLSGLAHVDAVRSFQGAGLPAVEGTGLTLAQAIEEFRRERRVALAIRGLAFYDARRWNVLAPQSAGGGRSGAMIVVPANVYDPEGDGLPAAYPCYIEYDYVEYWDLPADELDFNSPLEGSTSIKN
jgi:starch-binding outer membrane protein, SusD/RagB family